MPAAGHVHPAVPIATALVGRGHQVLWHTGQEYARTVEPTGARLVPFDRTPDFTAVPPEPDPGTHGPAEAVSALRNLLIARMAGQLADYEHVADRYGVDAVLVDLCALGGRALYERRGIPWATLGISPLTIMSPDTPSFGTGRPPPTGPLGRMRVRLYNRLGGLLMRGLTRAYAQERSRLGLSPLRRGTTLFDHMISPLMHLQAATPSIEYPRHPWPANVHLVGPLLPEAPAHDLPRWWAELDGARVVVHVTQGTVATDPASLTRPAALGPVPGNVRVAPFIPHALLLPKVHAMVTNGGYNGVKTALAHGVPLVIAPWGNDQPDVAGRVAWAAAAARIRAEFARYPGGEPAADLLERLARQDRVAGTSPR